LSPLEALYFRYGVLDDSSDARKRAVARMTPRDRALHDELIRQAAPASEPRVVRGVGATARVVPTRARYGDQLERSGNDQPRRLARSGWLHGAGCVVDGGRGRHGVAGFRCARCADTVESKVEWLLGRLDRQMTGRRV
jgi:hypothetical protein